MRALPQHGCDGSQACGLIEAEWTAVASLVGSNKRAIGRADFYDTEAAMHVIPVAVAGFTVLDDVAQLL